MAGEQSILDTAFGNFDEMMKLFLGDVSKSLRDTKIPDTPQPPRSTQPQPPVLPLGGI